MRRVRASGMALRKVYKTPLPEAIIMVLASVGIRLDYLPQSLANEIVNVIISEALRNAICPKRFGALHPQRVYGAMVW
jgi:hypothetical protein